MAEIVRNSRTVEFVSMPGGVEQLITLHNADTTNVHGIPNTADLITLPARVATLEAGEAGEVTVSGAHTITGVLTFQNNPVFNDAAIGQSKVANLILDLNTLAAGIASRVSSVTGTAPVVSSGGTTPAISMPAATAAVNGYMTAAYASKLDNIGAGANVTSVNTRTGAVVGLAENNAVVHLAGAETITGLKTFQPSAPGNVGLIVQGAVGQTGDLIQAKSSAGSVLAKVTSIGAVVAGPLSGSSAYVTFGVASENAPVVDIFGYFGALGAALVKNQNLGANSVLGTTALQVIIGGATGITATPMNTANPAMVARGIAAQTADLFQAQNSAGSVLSKITAGGASEAQQVGAGPGSLAIGTGSLRVTSQQAPEIIVIVRAAAAQTGDLQRWQDSAGTSLVVISSAGRLGIGTPSPGQALTVSDGNIQIAGTQALRYIITNETATGTAQLIIQAGAGSSGFGGALNLYAHAHATKPGWVTAGISAASGVTGTATEGRFTVNNTAHGGGADLFTVLRTGPVGINFSAPTAQLQVHSSAAATVGAIVRGFTAQSANLQEWQNSAGGVSTAINSGGGYRQGSGDVGVFGSLTNVDSSMLQVLGRAAAEKVLLVRGITAQTADLQQWQDSAGTVLTRVRSTGEVESMIAGNGIILKSPGGTSYRVTVDNAGIIDTVAV